MTNHTCTNIAAHLPDMALLQPDRPAIIFPAENRTATFRELGLSIILCKWFFIDLHGKKPVYSTCPYFHLPTTSLHTKPATKAILPSFSPPLLFKCFLPHETPRF